MPEYNRVVTRYRNGITEVKNYQYYQRYGYSVKKEKSKHKGLVTFKSDLGRKKGKKSDFNEVNVYKNCIRAKSKIRALCNENSHILTKFLTLTFAEECYTEEKIDEANKLFKKFIMRLSYKYGKVEYLCVPELTKIGRIHYHVLCNLPYIPTSVIQEIWKHGIVHITRIDDIRNVGAYLSSYVDKDFGKAFSGKKHFLKSRGIVYPISEKIDSELDNTEYNIKNCVYCSEYENSFCGTVDTNVYNNNFEWK